MAWIQLKHLPVVSQSGVSLGRVEGFVFDPETHAIFQYEVRYGAPLSRKTYLIGTAQVVSVTAERMVVEDGAVATTQKAEQATATGSTVTTLASTRKVSLL